MKHRIRYAAIGALALLTLAGCQGHGYGAGTATNDKTASDFTLRLHTVPADRIQAIRDSLLDSISGNGTASANISISVAAPGKLLVYAPADLQDSVGDVIETLSKTAAPQAVPVQVGVHFWVIDGEPGAGENDPALKDLASSLASLQQALGPLHFHLDQAASLVGTSNHGNALLTADGHYQRSFFFRVDAINGDASTLQLTYEDPFGHGMRKLNTQIDATFGQYIVLAQAPGACPQPSTNNTPATCPDKPAMRLLVVRVDRLNPKA